MERRENLPLKERLSRVIRVLLIPGFIIGVIGLSYVTNGLLNKEVHAVIPTPTPIATSTPKGGICDVSSFTGFTSVTAGKVTVLVPQFSNDHVPCDNLTTTPAPTSRPTH